MMSTMAHQLPYDMAFQPSLDPTFMQIPYDERDLFAMPAYAYPPVHARSGSYDSDFSTFSAYSAYSAASSFSDYSDIVGPPVIGLCPLDPALSGPPPVQATSLMHMHTSSSPLVLAPAPVLVTRLPNRPLAVPRRRSPAVRQHGPVLLPKIRVQDQALLAKDPAEVSSRPVTRAPSTPPAKRVRALTPDTPISITASPAQKRPCHFRNFTSPGSIGYSVTGTSAPTATPHFLGTPSSVDCSPDSLVSQPSALSVGHSRSFSSPHHMPAFICSVEQARSLSPFSEAADSATAFTPPSPPLSTVRCGSPASPELSQSTHVRPRSTSPAAPQHPAGPTTSLLAYLTEPNPAPSLVRSISFPLRDANTKHFWWDVRHIQPWADFNTSALLSLPGASSVLSCPVPAVFLPVPAATDRHLETEAALHRLCAAFYLPKINAALAASSARPLQLSVPAEAAAPGEPELLFTANPADGASAGMAAARLPPSAHVVGLVRSYERFNSGMRLDGNVQRVEYLRTLAALHHAMRAHGTRYGFVLTEIELVVVRNGHDHVPHFGFLELVSVPLATAAALHQPAVPLTACLALWGLCTLASDHAAALAHHNPHPNWRAAVGVPGQATRQKALSRDPWIPAPQVAEKRQAKRARGWVWPEDPVGKKEAGKRS